MEIDVTKLSILVEEESGIPSVGPVPLPTLADVLYEPAARPMLAQRGRTPGTRPSGRRSSALALVGKRCDGCRLWAERENKCCIIGRQFVVTADMVCGYHVAGEPQLYVTALSGEGSLMPERAGLIHAPANGTSCDSCRYYEPLTDIEGHCIATTADESGAPAYVDPLGCCARWCAKRDPDVAAIPPLDPPK